MRSSRAGAALALGFACTVFACASIPRSIDPVFHLCASNVAAVRAEPGESSEIEVQLRSGERRAFELFAKRHAGRSVRLVAGETPVGEVTVLFGFRTGRLTFEAEGGRVLEVFEALNPPPASPCGDATGRGA